MWTAIYTFLKMIPNTNFQERTQTNVNSADRPSFNHHTNLRCSSDPLPLPLPQDFPTQDICTIIMKPVLINTKVQSQNNIIRRKTIPWIVNHPNAPLGIYQIDSRYLNQMKNYRTECRDKNTRQFLPLVIKIHRKNRRTQVTFLKLTTPRKTFNDERQYE